MSVEQKSITARERSEKQFFQCKKKLDLAHKKHPMTSMFEKFFAAGLLNKKNLGSLAFKP